MAQIQNEKVPVLKITDLCKNYGGLQVLAGIDLEIQHGELHALIGSNGAGKTTLFDIICGFIKPSRGTVQFMGREITSLPGFKYAHLGIGRTFQITTLFRTITVLDNLRLSLEALPATRLPFLKSGSFSERNLEPIVGLLDAWGLWKTRNVPVAALPYGVQRQLEIVMALIQKPRLLLLDEPMAGLEAGNRASMTKLIKESSGETTIFFIEHDMNVALQLADRVTVLHQGKRIAQGSSEEVQNNREVQRIYFGFEEMS
ncbi:MAG: ABC transporter ATP-binding protein [Syntrophorhabdales bacterium]|jgi:branched-chain amino acid transport system ATP-binding protein